MKIIINNNSVDIENEETLADVIASQGFPPHGIAVAVDNKVVSKDIWNEFKLYDGMKLTVIRAVCGG